MTGSLLADREIVVAMITPLGCPADETENAFKDAFARHDYRCKTLRISMLLDEEVPDEAVVSTASDPERLMDKGDLFRQQYNSDGACAYMAAQRIAMQREEDTGDPTKHRTRHVTLVRSLKTPGEVRVLRQIYGPRVVVVGVSASHEARRVELIKELRRSLDKDEAVGRASRLLERDEKDERPRFGQRTRDAFQLADAFVVVGSSEDRSTVDRFVDLLLGDPFQTPTRDEQGMFSAWGARFRSSAAGRQVGAAIVDRFGEVVALGCNDVPKPGGGQYWTDDADDRRDFRLGFDANDRGKHGAAASLLAALRDAGWLAPDRGNTPVQTLADEALQEGGPLDASELADLIEYGRIVHAEMAALMTAARSGRPVEDCTLYTTTYPCHECARLIIAAGVRRVCFVDPYPKSRASDLYEAMWGPDGTLGTVWVEQFAGVSPRMFSRLFEASNRAKNVDGSYEEWARRQLVVLDEELADSIPLHEKAAAWELKERRRQRETRESDLETFGVLSDSVGGT